ncbi:MAG: hypothetical protein ABR559_10470 [Gemmatimonadota bacterium]
MPPLPPGRRPAADAIGEIIAGTPPEKLIAQYEAAWRGTGRKVAKRA